MISADVFCKTVLNAPAWKHKRKDNVTAEMFWRRFYRESAFGKLCTIFKLDVSELSFFVESCMVHCVHTRICFRQCYLLWSEGHIAAARDAAYIIFSVVSLWWLDIFQIVAILLSLFLGVLDVGVFGPFQLFCVMTMQGKKQKCFCGSVGICPQHAVNSLQGNHTSCGFSLSLCFSTERAVPDLA